MYEDKTLVCKECGNEFVFTAGEQEFYAERGFQNEPQRCKACRDARKNATRGPREFFTATCARCGGEAKVPFQPKSDRPVFCSECFAQMRANGEYAVIEQLRNRTAYAVLFFAGKGPQPIRAWQAGENRCSIGPSRFDTAEYTCSKKLSLMGRLILFHSAPGFPDGRNGSPEAWDPPLPREFVSFPLLS